MYGRKMSSEGKKMLRLKAEEVLLKKKSDLNKKEIENDPVKLLHELQVHQIELEMQNEELIEANASAEVALKKYTMLYDFAPMGYFTLDKEGTICDLNFTGAEILCDKRFALINSNFKLFISEDSKSVFGKFFQDVFNSNRKEACKVMLGYDGKPLCQVSMEGIVTGDDRNCLLSVVDLTDFLK